MCMTVAPNDVAEFMLCNTVVLGAYLQKSVPIPIRLCDMTQSDLTITLDRLTGPIYGYDCGTALEPVPFLHL